MLSSVAANYARAPLKPYAPGRKRRGNLVWLGYTLALAALLVAARYAPVSAEATDGATLVIGGP